MLNEKYDPKISEKKWQNYWLDYGKKVFLQTNQSNDLKLSIYSFLNDSKRNQTFVIDTPPPTVSGLLHMGHIFSYTQADFVARFNRMQGKDVFYPMGFDDNGLPTERLVEKIIGKKAMIYEQEMQQKNQGGSGYFVEKCKEIVEQSEQEFEQLFKQIALSIDWQEKYQTISPESQKISQASFIDLFNKGLVEKQNQPVFWDISDRTALAQADIIDKEIEGEMFFIDFKIQGSDDPLEIMTTRPELLPACVAVMINGQDDRYQNLILDKDKFVNQGSEGQTGSFAISPLFGVIVPIIADNSVQIDKGTGVVMCCTFGDEMDLKWWRKYGLCLREIINDDGTLKNLISINDQDLEYKKMFTDYAIMCEKNASFLIEKKLILDPKIFIDNYQKISNQKIKEAKKIIIELLSRSSIFNSPLEGESKSQSDFGGGSEKNFVHSPIFNSPLEGESKSQSDFGGGSEKNFAQRNYELKNLPRSKELRSNMTDHEKILWYKINNDQLGYKFRRQQPIGNYIVDFVCFERNLIIELDGSGHAEKIEYDANRDQFLQNQGFRILRLWNNEFLENVNGIMDYIVNLLDDLKLTPHQNRFAILTPPQGGSFSLSSNADLQTQNQVSNKIKSQKITRAVKCAERSGVPIEIISKPQWFIKILDKKEQLKQRASMCNWYPDYMRVRIEQWIDGLSWDWCISRQRFFGVKFPVWNLESFNPEDFSQVKPGEWSFDVNLANRTIIADILQLPVDPEIDIPLGFTLANKSEIESAKKIFYIDKNYTFSEHNFNKKVVKDSDGKFWFITPETDVMDTWMTSSISPQLSSKGISDDICFNQSRHQKLFPADMRPQAHEIIRTWAFYTIVKAYFHSLNIEKNAQGEIKRNADGSIKLIENSNPNQSIPWHSLMISGWCLASDKTKMSKSKGNVITPQSLIEEKSADVVRYWASASSLGADIAYSEEVFKIGQKLITKIYNSAKFCSQHFAILHDYLLKNNIDQSEQNLLKLISHDSDLWILSQMNLLIKNYNQQFEIYEYGKARELLEEFFWHYFCDNYLEICKVRSYGLEAQKYQTIDLSIDQKNSIINNQISALITLNLLLKNILKLFAPFLPHLCEDIYSQIFVDEFNQQYSIHARGNHANICDLNLNQSIDYDALGSRLLEIIFNVRKYKSQKNLSMKFMLNSLEIPNSYKLNSIVDDLANVCNSEKIIFSNCQELLIN